MAPCHSCSTDAEILNKAHYVAHTSSTILIKQTNAGHCCSKKTTSMLTSYDQEIGRTFEVLHIWRIDSARPGYRKLHLGNHCHKKELHVHFTQQPNGRYSISRHD
ncbi:hypothetical protein T05_13890, partial [Trichinella murrelli]